MRSGNLTTLDLFSQSLDNSEVKSVYVRVNLKTNFYLYKYPSYLLKINKMSFKFTKISLVLF